jgi:N-methylhydantoinase A
MQRENVLRIGIDIGGTFTDFVVFDPKTGSIEAFKRLSTPENPAEAVLAGLGEYLVMNRSEKERASISVHIVHGSTVATNALLERKGARTALVATRGFGDVLQIGRQNRPVLYDLSSDPPPPLVPEQLRYEVDERVDCEGQVLVPLDLSGFEAILSSLHSSGVESVAVSLLFSFLFPEHERALASSLREAGFFVSPSCEILPEYREYERTSTTAVNAYVSPVLDRYLAHLEGAILPGVDKEARWRVMQSNGGNISIAEARRAGVRCILSGPAGGIVAARAIAAQTSPEAEASVITFDMGGTSTDVALIVGEPGTTTEAIVGGCPVSIPVLDIHTIGAGGGSIARADTGGALRVGPESAGAFPGPACYGRRDISESQATVTDANLVLGRFVPEYFLGGEMPLDPGRAEAVLAALGKELGLDPIQTALGVIEVVNTHMERALRVISVERGYDPQDFSLLSFGGAGGLHAADLARRLVIPQVIIPPLASTLSAFGMLAADVIKDYSQTVMFPGDAPLFHLSQALEPLVQQGISEILAEGISRDQIEIFRSLDIRYHGQSYELTIPLSTQFIPDFHREHERAYGYQRMDKPVEIVNLRIRAVGRITPPVIPGQPLGPAGAQHALIEERLVYLSTGKTSVSFYRGEDLNPGNLIAGPAVVARKDTTILLGPSDQAQVDGFYNLVITVGG